MGLRIDQSIMNEVIAVEVIFIGRVQGVGFRATCQQLAQAYRLVGFVKNMPDGSVQLWAQAEQDEIEAYFREIQKSRLGSLVINQNNSLRKVDSTLKSFEIRYF